MRTLSDLRAGISLAVAVTILSFFPGCTMNGLKSSEAVFGSLLGAGAGAGAGAIAAHYDDSLIDGAAIAIGSGTGAAVGLLAGGLVFDDKVQHARKQPVIRRVGYLDFGAQKEIEAKAEEIRGQTTEGSGEFNSWNSRYLGENPAYPYQKALSP